MKTLNGWNYITQRRAIRFTLTNWVIKYPNGEVAKLFA
jgi:hypothetical protein